MQLTLWQFIHGQAFTTVPPVVHEDLSGKTVVVIGANNGIGFEAAKHFATMNPTRLILACRSSSRGEAALAKLKQETDYKNAEMWILDLSSFTSVKAFAERYEKEGGRLDILVENAATIPQQGQKTTEDGWEPTFQVNNLSTSLLALRLLPRMLETAERFSTLPRIVVVSSEVHFWSKMEKNVMDSPNPLQTFGIIDSSFVNNPALESRYNDTKLLNILFTRSLSSRLHKRPLIVNTVNPGYCYSGLRASFSGFQKIFDWLMEKALARTSEEGARQLVWAALGEKGNEDALRGAYISLAQVSEPSDYVISKEGEDVQEKLWENLVNELSKVDSKVRIIVDKYLDAPHLT